MFGSFECANLNHLTILFGNDACQNFLWLSADLDFDGC